MPRPVRPCSLALRRASSPGSCAARRAAAVFVAIAAAAGCGEDRGPDDRPDAVDSDVGDTSTVDASSDRDGSADDATAADTATTDVSTDPSEDAPDDTDDLVSIRVMTFNTGTGARPAAELADTYGWTREAADLGDTWYGNGLAWVTLVDAMAPWVADRAPDIVGFQEIFWPGDCDAIPVEAHPGFVCDGDRQPTVAERLVGAGYTVACHPGRPDKCLAVRDAFARMDGCDAGFCLEGLDGATVDGCGSGSRVGRTRLTRPDGTSLDVVHVHGTSGFSPDDTGCRVAWFDAAFADLDPVAPTVMLGDFNTDPARAAETDASAARLTELATTGGFTFATRVGVEARPTYGGVLNIDHVLVRDGHGTCLAGGLDDDLPAPLAVEAFDHRPIVCDVTLR